MVNPIVTVNVSQNIAPAPNRLQRTGAIISQGGTTHAANTLTLLTQLSDLTSVLAAAKAVTSLSQSAGLATITTTAPHGWTNTDVIPVVVSGAVPAGYNGTVTATVTGASTLTYTVSSGLTSPATGTITVTIGDEAELLAQATTFFAQGTSVPVYVLELGEGTAAEGVTALAAWIVANPETVYSYLVPKEWDSESTFKTFLGGFNTTTSKTYFFITSTTGTYSAYSALDKCAFVLVPAPNSPAGEFACAAPFWVALSYDPSSTNKVTPLAFAFLFNVTPWPTSGNGSTLTAFLAANVNYVGTGAEGGISTAILRNGHLLDGNPFNYWYSVDWVQLNVKQALANAVITGSNNPLAPLDYDQQGINVLQARAAQVFASGVSFGLAIGSVKQVSLPASDFAANFENGNYRGQLVINAEPFLVYTAENPSDYAIGRYAGLAGVWTVARGFEAIIFDLTATNFV